MLKVSRKRKTLMMRRLRFLILPHHTANSQKKRKREYSKQRLLDYPIGKSAEDLTEITKPYQEFVRSTRSQNIFSARKSLLFR
jgi:hypothetical protein